MKSLKTIIILSVLGAREWIRLKFFHLVIFISILFIGFSHLLSSLTFAVQERLLIDFGLSGLELGLILISTLIGSHSIQREIDRKTLFVLLARPLPRWHIVIGAWGALVILNCFFTIGFGFSLLVTSGFWKLSAGYALACAISLVKSFLISSVAIALGLLVRPILAFGTTVSFWILCYSLPDIQFFAEKLKNPVLIQITKILDYLIPQFYRFNWKSYYAVTTPPDLNQILWALSHTFGWTMLWLFLASLFFKRKEIA